jgi:AcrR family transcriptional regulator
MLINATIVLDLKVPAKKPAAKRSKRADAQESHATLLQAARELVAERGMDGLTVVAVAQRAGLNRSTAYQHFRTRDELIDAVRSEFGREVRRIFSEPRQIGDQIDFFVHYFRDRPDIARMWMFRMLSDHDETASRGWADYVQALERLGQSPRSQDGIDAEMLGVIGMTSALVWSLMARNRSTSEAESRLLSERFARELKRLFLHGALRPEAWPELVRELEDPA